MSIIISSPASSASVSGTVALNGVKNHPPVLVKDGATTLSSVALASQSFGAAINTTSFANGSHTFTVTDGVDTATVAVIINNAVTQPATELTINAPVAGASLSATFVVSGSCGSAWVNCAVWDSASGNKVGTDNTPAGGVYASSVNMGTLSGSRTLIVRGFSVAAGQPGGSQTAVTRAVFVTNNPGSVSTSTAPATLPFYGANAHYFQGGVYGTGIAQQVTDCGYMGITALRQDCNSYADLSAVNGLVSSFAPVKLIPIFNVYPAGTNESATYATYYTYGQNAATLLAGKVPIIELMNEPEIQYFNNGPSGNGQNITDMSASNSQWPAFRGACRGFLDGFRSVDTTKQTLIAMPSVGWLHYGIIRGLWEGTAPDGSSGNPTCRGDLINHHWYHDFGDIENAGNTNTNVLATLQTLFATPVILSEIGIQFSQTETTFNNYIASQVAFYATHAATYNIKGVSWYEMYNFQFINGTYMGLYSARGTKNAGRADAMKTVIAANPK